jgi:hypothetical protein
VITVYPIVEGHTEVYALPTLVRRIAADAGVHAVRVPKPFRLPRSRFTRPDEIGRAVAFAAQRVEHGCVLALADADDGCAVEFAQEVRTAAARPDLPLAVVAAVREFESLFLTASGSLADAGMLSMPFDGKPELVRDAAGTLSRLMAPTPYRKTADGARLASVLSLEEARTCRWYRKLESELARLFDV